MDCKICLQKYNGNIRKLTPRMLTKCGHTMCQSCIRKQIRNQRIVCPYDRKVTEVRNGADQLPKNYAVLEMMEESKTENEGVKEDVEDSGDDDLEDDEEEDSEDSSENSDDGGDSEDSEDSEDSDISSDESSDSDDSVTRLDVRNPGFTMDCKICLRKYNVTVPNRTPRILTKCGHTMCHYCIQQQTDDEKIVCPFDREVTEVANGAARNLPKNYALLEVIEMFGNEEDDVEDPLDNIVEEVVEEGPGNVENNEVVEENSSDSESSSSWETSSESESSESDNDGYPHSRFFLRQPGTRNRR